MYKMNKFPTFPNKISRLISLTKIDFQTRRSFTKINNAGGDKYVLGCGSNLLDKIFRVQALPKVGEKGFFESPMRTLEKTVVGGVTLNHLAWAAYLGVPCGLLALQGMDSTGRKIRQNLKDLNVTDSFIKVDSSFTSSESFVFVQKDGERSIVMAPGSTSNIDDQAVASFFRDAIEEHACILTTEISQVPLAGVSQLLKLAKQAGITTVLDFDISPSVAISEAKLGDLSQLYEILSLCDVLKPAKHAAQELISLMKPGLTSNMTSKDVVQYLLDNTSAKYVAMTNGSLPSTFAMSNCCIEVDAIHFENVVDGTGAGDAFLGGLIAGFYHYGFPEIEEELRFLGEIANKVGSANVMALGGVPAETSKYYLANELAGIISIHNKEGEISDDTSIVYESITADMASLESLKDVLNPKEIIDAATQIMDCKGTIFTTGIGKSGIVAERLASSLSSVHLASSFVHAAEWAHGDLGKLKEKDIVICISHSGSTAEVLHPVSFILKKCSHIISIVGNSDSKLAHLSEHAICYATELVPEILDVIPSRSLIVQEAIINALISTIINKKEFTRRNFLQNHPGGAIGDRFYEN